MADQNTSAPSEPLRFDATTTSSAPNDGVAAAAVQCGKCGERIGAYYYEAAGAIFCARCKGQVEQAQATSGASAGIARGVIFGIGAAIAGAVGYFLITVTSGFNLGLVALGVAWLVASAVKKGTSGAGGQTVQIVAVALTAAAIGLANLGFGGFPPSIINVIIIGFSLRYAWQLSAGGAGTTPDGRLAFTGPYKVAAQRTGAA